MKTYRINWKEIHHFSSTVKANSIEEAKQLFDERDEEIDNNSMCNQSNVYEEDIDIFEEL